MDVEWHGRLGVRVRTYKQEKRHADACAMLMEQPELCVHTHTHGVPQR